MFCKGIRNSHVGSMLSLEYASGKIPNINTALDRARVAEGAYPRGKDVDMADVVKRGQEYAFGYNSRAADGTGTPREYTGGSREATHGPAIHRSVYDRPMEEGDLAGGDGGASEGKSRRGRRKDIRGHGPVNQVTSGQGSPNSEPVAATQPSGSWGGGRRPDRQDNKPKFETIQTPGGGFKRVQRLAKQPGGLEKEKEKRQQGCKGKCFRCGQEGHWRRDCKQQSGAAPEAVCSLALGPCGCHCGGHCFRKDGPQVGSPKR